MRTHSKARVTQLLRNNPDAIAYMLDINSEWTEYRRVWLNQYGVLVEAHPTDDERSVPAPDEALYFVELPEGEK